MIIKQFLAGMLILALTSAPLAWGNDFLEQSACLVNLSKLSTKSGDEGGHTSAELRDGLFTFAVIESPLLTSKNFIDRAHKIYESLKPIIPDADWGKADLKKQKDNIEAFEKEYAEAKYSYEYRMNNGYQDIVAGPLEEMRQATAKLNIAKTAYEKLESERKKQMELRTERQKLFPPEFRKIPTLVQVKLAEDLWKDLLNDYALTANPDALDFNESRVLTEKAKQFGITFKDYITLHIATHQIDNDPILREKVVELIADLLGSMQGALSSSFIKIRKIAKYRKAFKKDGAIRKENYDLKIIFPSNTDPDHITVREGADELTLKQLLTDKYQIFLNDSYFYAIGEVFKKENINIKEFSDNFIAFSATTKQSLAEKIWLELKNIYFVSSLSTLNVQEGAEIARRADDVNLSPDTFLKNAFLIKAVDDSPSLRMATFKLIVDSLKDTIELAPHIINAINWKKDFQSPDISWGQVAAIGGSMAVGAASGVHYLTGLDPLAGYYHPLSTFGHFIFLGAGPAMTGITGALTHSKIREKIARFKFKRALKKTQLQSPSHDGEAE